MRQFYLSYKDHLDLQQVVGENSSLMMVFLAYSDEFAQHGQTHLMMIIPSRFSLDTLPESRIHDDLLTPA